MIAPVEDDIPEEKLKAFKARIKNDRWNKAEFITIDSDQLLDEYLFISEWETLDGPTRKVTYRKQWIKRLEELPYPKTTNAQPLSD
ncbi:MAG: hypothetical protein AAFV95_21835 [Bacteroidota bacterium]